MSEQTIPVAAVPVYPNLDAGPVGVSPGDSWARLNKSRVLCEGPCLLKAVIFEPSDSGHYVTVYDGLGTSDGRTFAVFREAVRTTHAYYFGAGVRFEFGLYVAPEDTSQIVTVIFRPLPA